MKKMIAALVAVIAMSGCTVNVGDKPSEPETSASTAQTVDEAYIAYLEDEMPQFADADEETLISAGKSVCTYFDDYGVSLTTLGTFSEAFSSSFSQEETAVIILGATTAYCPDTKAEILALTPGSSA